MTDHALDQWHSLTYSSNGANVASTGVQAAVKLYQDPSEAPHTSLMNSGRKLEMVKLRLQGLSPQQRAEIEIANRNNDFDGRKSLEDLEDEHLVCVLLIMPSLSN
jgi:hypothetical protein